MSDPIEREDVYKALTIAIDEHTDVFDAVERIPSADITSYEKGYVDAVQGIADELVRQGKHIESDRPQGKWIPTQVSSGRDSWKCSVCGRRARGKIENLPYCHCGARMLPQLQGKRIDSIIIDENP